MEGVKGAGNTPAATPNAEEKKSVDATTNVAGTDAVNAGGETVKGKDEAKPSAQSYVQTAKDHPYYTGAAAVLALAAIAYVGYGYTSNDWALADLRAKVGM